MKYVSIHMEKILEVQVYKKNNKESKKKTQMSYISNHTVK